MNAKSLAIVLGAALGLSPAAWADHAHGGGGSSHSGGSSHGGSSSSGSAHGGSTSGHSSRHDSSGSRSSAPSDAVRDAASRHPEAGSRYGRGFRSSGRFYGGYYGRPFFGFGLYSYPYYYDPFYADSYYSPYGYYGGYSRYPRSRYGYGEVGSIRLQVEPDKARVYVDGYYTGIADDFDGLFQRLHISPGPHILTFRMEGYKTHRVKVYVPEYDTLKVRWDLVRGDGNDERDEVASDTEVRDQRADRGRRYGRDEYDDRERYADRDPDRDEERNVDRDRDRDFDRDRDRDGHERADRGRREVGSVHLRVRPEDASVYVDGELRGSGRRAESVELPAGRHRIEVVKPGFRTFQRELEITAGRSQDLDVELERSGT
jgi:hypothetical protein